MKEQENRRLEHQQKLEQAKLDNELKKSEKAKPSPPVLPPRPASMAENTNSAPERRKAEPPVCNVILQPQRASPITVTAASGGASSSTVAATTNSVNIKDFENLAEDPFESAELNTINDMEELKSLLSQTIISNRPLPTVIDNESNNQQATDSCEASANESITGAEVKVTDKPKNDVYENVFQRRYPKRENIYENPTLSAPATRPQSVSNLKLPIPSPRRSCNSEPTSPQQSQLTLESQLVVPANEKSKDSDSKPQKPAVKPKPKVKPAPGSDQSPSAKAVATPPSTKAVTTPPSTKAVATPPSTNVAALSSLIEGNLCKSTRPKIAGFSYTKDTESIKDIEWPTMDSASPSTAAITTSPFTKTVHTFSAADSSPTATVVSASNQIQPTKQLKPVRPPPPAPKKGPPKKPTVSSNQLPSNSSATNGVSSSGNYFSVEWADPLMLVLILYTVLFDRQMTSQIHC